MPRRDTGARGGATPRNAENCTINNVTGHLIIASGYNIAPAEVERYLYHHPAVQEAAVVGVPDEYRGEAVKAFVVPKQEARRKVTEEDIITFGKEKMPAYKAPKIVEFIDEIPKNLTGKVLHRVLREREKEKGS
ncbi:MAG: hypothetical protein JRS35_02905 [Deltaproteobacteria bacterium]|nr:hypothetical protein [Deltaproteobacteria bacterium]